MFLQPFACFDYTKCLIYEKRLQFDPFDHYALKICCTFHMLVCMGINFQEELQKEAFDVLQCQKDARHQRITSQILLIEQELTELTLLELEQRQLRLDTQVVCNVRCTFLT